MKHYAPNRCLYMYIKVAKLRTGVGRRHTYKIPVSKYQGRCEQRSEVFVKIQKKNWGGGGVRSGGMFRRGGGGGYRVDVNKELKFF